MQTDTMASTAKKGINQAKREASNFADEAKDQGSNLLATVENFAEELKKGSGDVAKLAEEYSEAAVDYVKKHPVAFGVGLAGVGLLAGLYLARRK